MRAAVVLRPATDTDIGAVVELVQAAYRGEGGPGRWTTEAHLVRGTRATVEEISSLIHSPRSVLLVAEDEAGLLACCHVKALPEEGRAYFGLFAVRPGRQGAGVGRTVLDRAESWARQNWGAETMEMQVIDGREELLSWYDRLGYRRTGRTVAFPYDKDDDVPLVPGLRFVVLEKPITP